MLDGASAASAANEAAPLVAAARSLADSGIGKALPKLREALAGLPARLKAAVIARRNNPDGNSADAATTSLDAIAEALAQDLPGTNWRNGQDGVLDASWAADADLLPDLLPIAIAGAYSGFEGSHRIATFANASDAQLLALGVEQADVANIRAGLERSPHHAARAIDDAFARLDPNSDTARASQRDLATDSNANSGVTITARLDGSFRVRDADGNEIGTAKDAGDAAQLAKSAKAGAKASSLRRTQIKDGNHNSHKGKSRKAAPNNALAASGGPPYEPPNKQIPTIGGRKPINFRYAGKIHPAGVRFTEQGFPIFTPFSVISFPVKGLTGKRKKDQRLANKKAGLKRTPKGFTWHHVEDGLTMQLVPDDIHDAVRHTGGAAIIRNGGFDR